MTDELYRYLEKEWRYNNHSKYQKYFKEWVSNVTPQQILYFKAHLKGKMSMY